MRGQVKSKWSEEEKKTFKTFKKYTWYVVVGKSNLLICLYKETVCIFFNSSSSVSSSSSTFNCANSNHLVDAGTEVFMTVVSHYWILINLDLFLLEKCKVTTSSFDRSIDTDILTKQEKIKNKKNVTKEQK